MPKLSLLQRLGQTKEQAREKVFKDSSSESQ